MPNGADPSEKDSHHDLRTVPDCGIGDIGIQVVACIRARTGTAGKDDPRGRPPTWRRLNNRRGGRPSMGARSTSHPKSLTDERIEQPRRVSMD